MQTLGVRDDQSRQAAQQSALYGLNGRFCQPRPTAWEFEWKKPAALTGPFAIERCDWERPFQGRSVCRREPRPSAWAGGTSLTGSKTNEPDGQAEVPFKRRRMCREPAVNLG